MMELFERKRFEKPNEFSEYLKAEEEIINLFRRCDPVYRDRGLELINIRLKAGIELKLLLRLLREEAETRERLCKQVDK